MSHKATAWAVIASQGHGLSWPAKGVLWHLADRHNPGNGCFPSQKRLAADCEVSQSQLNVHLDALERAGLIRRIRRLDPTTKRQLSTRYMLAFDPGFQPLPHAGSSTQDQQTDMRMSPEPSPEIGVGIDAENATEPTPILAPSRLRLTGVAIKNEPVREPVICVSEEGEAGAIRAFAEFWVLHPRPQQRDACRRIFLDAVQAGEDASAIISGARRYAEEQAGNRAMYVCRSDNWLKERRWREASASGDTLRGEPADVGEYWAGIVRAGRYFPLSAHSPALLRAMLDRGLVNEAELAKAGVRL